VVLDQVEIAFDDEHAVASAGLLLAATLAERLGIEQAADQLVDLGGRPGAARPGRKLLTLVHAMVAGGDGIDDVELLRCGSTASVLGHRVMAASTVGTFLRAFTFGHVRQLDRVCGQVLARAWAAGAGPGDGPLVGDVDSTICEVHGYHKQGACYGYTRRLGYRPLLATRADTGEVLHARLRKAGASGELTLRADSGFWSAKLIRRLRGHRVRYSITVRQIKAVRAAIAAIPEAAWVPIASQPDGAAQVAETGYQGDRLIVRRVRNQGEQAQLFATLARNLIRWIAALGLGVGDQQTVAKTLRRTLLHLPGRLTRSARQWTLHLPAGWPWAHSFTMALARLRCIPYPT
jgi:hypothetical protein